jgi:hypothetical protein
MVAIEENPEKVQRTPASSDIDASEATMGIKKEKLLASSWR